MDQFLTGGMGRSAELTVVVGWLQGKLREPVILILFDIMIPLFKF
jgi:predicted Rossmann-fold nucleotide-binding protein